jgi:hypothetical protein
VRRPAVQVTACYSITADGTRDWSVNIEDLNGYNPDVLQDMANRTRELLAATVNAATEHE